MLPEEKVKALGENVTELFKYVNGMLCFGWTVCFQDE